VGERRRWCYDSGDWNWPELGQAQCIRKFFFTRFYPQRFRIFLVLIWLFGQRREFLWRQGFGEWLCPLQSPFSTAGFPAALEEAATGGSTEESSSLTVLLVSRLICSSSVEFTLLYNEHKEGYRLTLVVFFSEV
jgi:hypothetical protein